MSGTIRAVERCVAGKPRVARRLWIALLLVAVASPPAVGAPLLFATRPSGGEVVVIDLATGGVIDSLPAGALPAGAVYEPAGARLLVADSGNDGVYALPAGGPSGQFWSSGAAPAGIAACPGGPVLVADSQDDTLTVLDTATGALLSTLPVGDGPLAVACDGGVAAVANYGDDTVSLVEVATLAVDTVATGAFPAGVVMSAGRVFVANFADDTVSVIDAVSHFPLATVPVGSAPRGMAAAGGRVFVANLNDGTVSVIDAATALVIATWPLPAASPADLLVADARLFVSHPGAPTLTELDAATGALVQSLAVPVGLVALAGLAPELPAAVPGASATALLALAAVLGGTALVLARGRGVSGGLLAMLLLGGALVASPPAAAQTFVDDDFADADWELQESTVAAGASQSAGQDLEQGNPEPARVMRHVHGVVEGGQIDVVHRFTGGNWDPGTDGAVASLDASWQRAVLAVVGAGGAVDESFVVIQGGVVYSTPLLSFSGSSWQDVDHQDLVATDFESAGGDHPDFSATASTLSFGYRRRNFGFGSPSTVTHAIDGFSVSVDTTAFPSAVGFARRTFVASGSAAAIGVRRDGDTAGAASVEVTLYDLDDNPHSEVASWADGEGGVQTVLFDLDSLSPLELFLGRFNLVLLDVAGATITPTRGRAVLLYGGNDAVATVLALLAPFLARFEPWGLLPLALIAGYLAWRRARSRPAASPAQAP